jgi:hypothetical protein
VGRCLQITLLVFLAGCGGSGLVQEPAPRFGWEGPGDWAAWSYRHWIALDNSGVDEALEDVPVLVRITPDWIDYDLTKAGGGDVRFVSETGLALSYEVERWQVQQESLAWVRIPTIPASPKSTGFWIYYGNPEAQSSESAADVWRNGFSGVWHLDSGRDSAHDNDIMFNTTSGGDAHVGLGRRWNGSGGVYAAVEDHETLSPHQQITVSAWVRADQWGGGNRRVLQKGNDDNQYRFTRENGALEMDIAGVGDARTPDDVASDQWLYLVGTYDGEAIRIYADAELIAEEDGLSGDIPVTQDALHFGTKRSGAPDGDSFDGWMDEIRISSVARTETWIELQHRSVEGSLLDPRPRETLSPP